MTRALLAAALLLAPSVLAGPITFVTALPVAQDQGVFRAQLNGTYGGGATLDTLSSVFAWGATDRISLFANVPTFFGSLQPPPAPRSFAGPADSLLYARYQLVRKNWLTRTFRIAPIAGFFAPTGSANASDRFGRLPQSLQTGSGALSPYLATALTWENLTYEYNADVSYRFNPSGAGYRPGNEFRADFSFQRRLLPWSLGRGVPSFLYFIAESNFYDDAPLRLNSSPLPQTGGRRWYLDPGLNFAAERWQVGAVAQIPLLQNLTGIPHPPHTIGVVAFFQLYFGMPSLRRRS